MRLRYGFEETMRMTVEDRKHHVEIVEQILEEEEKAADKAKRR